MEGRLSSGQSNASAGGCVEDPVLQQKVQDCIRGIGSADALQPKDWTSYSTAATTNATITVDSIGIILTACPCGANLNTIPAEKTLARIKTDFHARINSFRIVTPQAVKLATLEKDSGSNTWTTYQCMLFNINNQWMIHCAPRQVIGLSGPLTGAGSC